jgi:hypothetical protein
VLEVLVALTIGGLVTLAAYGIFTATTDAGRRLMAAREALDREANARRFLQAAFLSLEVGGRPDGGFEGRAQTVRFVTWLGTAAPWATPRRVTLGADGGAFVARLGGAGEPSVMRLADSVTAVAFDYLLEPGLDARWVREWISPVSAPLAVRVRVAKAASVDTLLFLIKERG